MSSDARPSMLAHATEELLEEYSFGRIREPQLGWLEEHLLMCPQCQAELDDIEEYKVFMKAGLAAFESERQAAAGAQNHPKLRWFSPRGALSFHLGWPRTPLARNLLAAALLLTLAGTAVAWRMRSPVASAPFATIKLIALRGGEEDSARAPVGRPLELVFNRQDLATDISYRAEVVDSSGRQIWSGRVHIVEETFSARVDRPLRAGTYWVRLYSSAGQLLREFGLSVTGAKQR